MIDIQLVLVGRLDFQSSGVEGPLRAFENRRDHGATVLLQAMPVLATATSTQQALRLLQRQ